MHILIGTDGSEDAIDAAAQAVGVLAAPDTITVLAVGETPGVATAGFESGFAGGIADPGEVDEAWAAVEDATNAAIDATADAIAAAMPGATIERATTIGDPGQALCEFAAEHPVDVIVVGSRGRGAIKRALLGSVSTHVVNNAPCPVLVIRADS